MYKAVIIDDKQIIVKGLSMLIDWPLNGYELAGTAFKGHTALSLIDTIQPHLVITDIQLGDMTGLELMQRIRDKGYDSQFIFISAYDNFNYCRTAISLGAVEYLLKPVGTEALINAIAKAHKRIFDNHILKISDPVRSEPSIHDRSSDTLIEQINHYIDCHYHEDLDITIMAKSFFLSSSYFGELFKKENGITFKKYQTRVRIEKAKRYLTETQYKFGEIASKVGYDNPTYFTQVFKKATGSTPSEYKNLFSTGEPI